MDTILRTQVPIHTYVDGFGRRSELSFLSVVGDYRFMSRNSYGKFINYLLHFWGTYSNFEDEKQNLDLMMKTIKNVYGKNIPKYQQRKLVKYSNMIYFGMKKLVRIMVWSMRLYNDSLHHRR